MHIFGEWIGAIIEFCRPNPTSVENLFCRAKNMGSQNGRRHMKFAKNSYITFFLKLPFRRSFRKPFWDLPDTFRDSALS